MQPVPAEYNAFAYVFSGEGRLRPRRRRPRRTSDGDVRGRRRRGLDRGAGTHEPLEVLLIAGVPLREPVARYGPFVMNTKEEIVKAFEDYREGRMGEIAPA